MRENDNTKIRNQTAVPDLIQLFGRHETDTNGKSDFLNRIKLETVGEIKQNERKKREVDFSLIKGNNQFEK